MSDMLQLAKDAAEATPPSVFYGELTRIAEEFKLFFGKGVPPKVVTRAEYNEADPQSRAVEVTFEVDSSRFNPRQKKNYARKVRLGSKDWRRTVAPSIIATFGSLETLREGTWIEVEDVPQFGNEDFSVPRFLRTFSSMQACADAWKMRNQPISGNTNDEVPADILVTARAVWSSVNDDGTFRNVVSQDPKLAQFDVEKLLTAVKS